MFNTHKTVLIGKAEALSSDLYIVLNDGSYIRLGMLDELNLRKLLGKNLKITVEIVETAADGPKDIPPNA